MAKLVLEDGKIFDGVLYTEGKSFSGEIMIADDMVGYEEIITNKKYEGAIIVFSYIMIGNYGINKSDMMGKQIYANCVIAKEFCDSPSNFRCDSTLKEFFTEQNTTSVCNIDTREIVRYIVKNGSMTGVVFSDKVEESVIPESLKSSKAFMKSVNKISKGE